VNRPHIVDASIGSALGTPPVPPAQAAALVLRGHPSARKRCSGRVAPAGDQVHVPFWRLFNRAWSTEQTIYDFLALETLRRQGHRRVMVWCTNWGCLNWRPFEVEKPIAPGQGGE